MRNLVIGVDGSSSSDRALEWAVTAVGPEGVIHAVAAVFPETELPARPVLGDHAGHRDRLARQLDAVWLAPARGRVATLTASVSEQDSATALRRAAIEHGADAIVVGSHIPPGVLPKTIGSTVRKLLPELCCPLIVVPDSATGGLERDRPVVVGVGHGEGTEAAVRWAADLANDRELPIYLVRATGEGPVFSVDGLLYLLAFYIDPSKRDEWTQEDLESLADDIRQMTGNEVTVETSTRSGIPARRLVDASREAGLLVIGQHRSAMTGDAQATQALRHALTHAHCPVAVIPLTPRDQ